MVSVSESDDGKEVVLALGDTLELALAETSGTGFRWLFKSRAESLLALKKEYIDGASSIAGSGRVHVWRFKAIASGEATLELAYERPWEKVAPARTLTLKVRAGSSS